MGHYKTSVTGKCFSSSAVINLTTVTVLDRPFTVPMAPNPLHFGEHLLIIVLYVELHMNMLFLTTPFLLSILPAGNMLLHSVEMVK